MTLLNAADALAVGTAQASAAYLGDEQVWSSFSPLDLSPVVWLDAADATTITASSGAVSQWRDKSGNNYHVAQGISANQPLTGAATLNGLNVLQFDGSNDSMSNTSVPSSSRPHTYVIVAKEVAGITAVKSLVNSGVTNILAFFFSGTSPSRQIRTFVSGGGGAGGPNVTTTNDNVLYVMVDGVITQFGVNGSYTTAGGGGTTRGAIFRVGTNAGANGEFFNGTIGEVFYFNATLSDTNRDRLTAYLTAKWGI
jgi:hypothetical protein